MELLLLCNSAQRSNPAAKFEFTDPKEQFWAQAASVGGLV
jgi:hypothetical protein